MECRGSKGEGKWIPGHGFPASTISIEFHLCFYWTLNVLKKFWIFDQNKKNATKKNTAQNIKSKKSQNMFKKGQNESMWEGGGVESKWAYQFSHVSYKC